MHTIKKLSLFMLLFILSTGCVPRQQASTTGCTPCDPTRPVGTATNNPNDLPIARTYPLARPQTPIPVVSLPTRPTTSNPPIPQAVRTEPIYIAPRSPHLRGDYAQSFKLKQFINYVSKKHNYDKFQLNSILSTVTRDTESLRKYNVFKTSKPSLSKATKVGSWDTYRGNFLTTSRVNKGLKFWQENTHYLNKAAQQYGVPAEYIVSIIGVETNFGSYTGKHSVLNALTTLSLEYKKRSKFFTSELENYLLVLRDERVHPQRMKGSYAGAFGLAQFMPSSFRSFAIDFDGDGHISLFNKADAIGSVANYFIERGKWQPGVWVAMKTLYNKKRFYGLATGHKTIYTQRHMQQIGMRPTSNFNGYNGDVSLIKLSRYARDEMWWGSPNFRAITRYNPRDHYAMAVHQLAQAIKRARYAR